jgi:DNA repair exonuclease SbcCD ATPase subunit
MDHYRLSDELRQQLLENAAWGKAGVTPRLDESETEERLTYGIDEQQGGRKAKKKAMKPKEGYMEDADYEDAEGSEELEEAVHVCPLCVSQLDQPLDEESILEHLNVVMGLVDRLTQLQEGEEDIESVIDETLAELLFQDLEEE